jgi:MFS family permease
MSILGGAGNGIQWISVVTAVQEVTPTDYQARIAGLLESIGAAMPGLGYLLGGALVALGSPRTAYAVAGAGVLLLVLGTIPLRGRLDPSAADLGPTFSPGDIPLPEPVTNRAATRQSA